MATLDRRAKELAAVYENLMKTQAALDDEAKEFGQALESCEDESEISYLGKKADELMKKTNALENEMNALESEINGIMTQYAQIKKRPRK